MSCKCDHPFFCRTAGARRSAWETPSCLSESDWVLAAQLAAASRQSCEGFLAFFRSISKSEMEAVCHRIIGYPEALSYLHTGNWAEKTFYAGFVKHQLPRLESALATGRNRME